MTPRCLAQATGRTQLPFTEVGAGVGDSCGMADFLGGDQELGLGLVTVELPLDIGVEKQGAQWLCAFGAVQGEVQARGRCKPGCISGEQRRWRRRENSTGKAGVGRSGR